jgi:hypothetical protein
VREEYHQTVEHTHQLLARSWEIWAEPKTAGYVDTSSHRWCPSRNYIA